MLAAPSDYDTLKISEAKEVQQALRETINLQALPQPIQTIAGADISLNRFSQIIFAGIVVLRYSDLQPIAYSLVQSITKFPYVPGYLAFREVPALVQAYEQMPVKPDVIMVDGHGIAHPRRMGIATHLGTLIPTPTLGCAKKILFGKFEEPAITRDSVSEIKDKEQTIGYAYRSKSKVKPVFISPGNNMTMDESLAIAKHTARAYRLPEPTRKAHEFVNLFRTGQLAAGYHEINAHQLF